MKIERNVEIKKSRWSLYGKLIEEICAGGDNAKLIFDNWHELNSGYNSAYQSAKRLGMRDKVEIHRTNSGGEHILYIYAKEVHK